MPKLRTFSDVAKVISEVVEATNREFLMDTWQELVDATPVKTGKARASWFVSPNLPHLKELPDAHYPYPAPPDLNRYTRNFSLWYIANTAHYIGQLNRGSSRQAPAGFVDTIIKRNVDRANRG